MDCPDYSLFIVGDYQPDSVDELKSNLNPGFRDKVHFLGVLSQVRINALMNEAAIFLLPSVSEGLLKVLLECQAAGLPIVTTDVGDCAKISRNAGLVSLEESLKNLPPQLFAFCGTKGFTGNVEKAAA